MRWKRRGVPQGGPLSPLLSHVVLDERDIELARRGHRFVRYANDGNIDVRSERAGKRVMESVTSSTLRRLRLKVNAADSAVARPEERHFVGFRLRREPRGGEVEVLRSKRSKAGSTHASANRRHATGEARSKRASYKQTSASSGGRGSSEWALPGSNER